jgi:hypothetical protein
MDNIKAKLLQFIDSLVVNLIVSVLITFLSVRISFIKNFLLTYINGNLLFVSVVLMLLTFSLFDILKRKLLYYTVYLKKNEIDRIYDYYNYSFEFISRELIRCSIKMKYRNTKSSFTKDTFRFKWSGSGYNINIKNCKIEQINNNSGFNEYLIMFPRAICKNEKVVVEIEMELSDENHTSLPEMQYNVNHPTKNLKMELKFPPGLNLNYVTKECLVGSSVYPVTSEECASGERVFTISKKNPLFLHKYRFGWDFRD